MNELQDTLEEIMEIFKCQEDMLDILENQQYQLEQLKLANQEQQELLEKLNAENMRLSAVGQRIEGDANDKLFFRPLKNRPRSLGANGRLTAIIRHIIGEY